jgi:predicted nucleic acid-binding protein
VTDKVVDASAIVALLFNERSRDAVVARLHASSLYAPSVIEFEVANACLKKMRASPAERDGLLQAFSLLDRLSIKLEAIDLAATLALAERTKLSVYDASYLWLVRFLGAELVTLDDRLARADSALRK